MASESTRPSFGQSLFRLRTLTPMPVIGVCLVLLYKSRQAAPWTGDELDALFDLLGLALCFAGQGLRLYTLGWVPEGTSGQDLTLQASTLNTKGPYAYVRNPLYVGNLGIIVGLLLVANDPWVALIALVFFFANYHFIINAEEAFLLSRFGAAYDEYRAKVSRWLPRSAPAYEGALRDGSFDWARAVKKEINPFSLWATGFLLLVIWENLMRRELEDFEPAFIALWAAIFLVWSSALMVKAWKKGWITL
jgi:protein-S-isoprenylcysteine O-methyltransferase Ste14